MRLLLVGNCQMVQLDQLIRFEDERIDLEIINVFSDISLIDFCEKISRADYIIARVYGSGCPSPFMRLSNLKLLAGAKLIVVPTVVNYALFPDFSYVSNIVVSGCPYIPISAIEGYIEQISSSEATYKFNDDVYHNHRNYDAKMEDTLRELKSLDEISDIKIANEVFSETYLNRSFYTHNHPRINIVNCMKLQIFEKIGLTSRRSVPLDLIKDVAKMGIILPISKVVEKKYNISDSNSDLVKLPTSYDAPDEWIEMQEMISRTFRVLYQRETAACHLAGLSVGQLHQTDRRLIIEFQPGMVLYVNQYTECNKNYCTHFYKILDEGNIEVVFSNDSDEHMQFDDQRKLGLRLQLWRGKECLIMEYSSYYVRVKTMRPRSSIVFTVPIPTRYLSSDGNGELHFRFGLFQEHVIWFTHDLPHRNEDIVLDNKDPTIGYHQGGILNLE